MKAIVLGIHSFLNNDVKVGSQYIAEGLADRGSTVDYISIISSPLDILYKKNRQRFQRVWIDGQDKHGIHIKPCLTEYAFKTLFPAHKLFLHSDRMINWFHILAPEWLKKRKYDVCIHDITSNILFLPYIQASHYILRLNDPPEGFAHRLHKKLIDTFIDRIKNSFYHEIWAVSTPLAEYALQLNPSNNSIVIPNGVEETFISNSGSISSRDKSAVYLGSVSKWVDLKLLEQTALLMPDWKFHIYGHWDIPWTAYPPNINRFPPVSREAVPDLLAGYQVGLIPYCEISGRMDFVERPLKFYEYIAAGLGVASTDVGSLKIGMGDFAAYGNTPQEFAKAIVHAANEGAKRPISFNHRFIKQNSWKHILQNMCSRISALQSK